MEDRELSCEGCGAPFPFTAMEQAFYARSGFLAPKRCKACRERRPPSSERPGGAANAAGLAAAAEAFRSSGTGMARDALVAQLERAGRRAAVVGGAVLAEDPERRGLLAPVQGAFQKVVEHIQRRTGAPAAGDETRTQSRVMTPSEAGLAKPRTRLVPRRSERHALGAAPVAVYAHPPHPLTAGQLAPEAWRELDRAAEKLTRRLYSSPDPSVWRGRPGGRQPREGTRIGRVTCTSSGPLTPWDAVPGAWCVELDPGSTTFLDAPAAERDAFLAELARLQQPVQELLAALPGAARVECTHLHRISDEDDDHGFLDAGWSFHVGPTQGLFVIEARKTWG